MKNTQVVASYLFPSSSKSADAGAGETKIKGGSNALAILCTSGQSAAAIAASTAWG